MYEECSKKERGREGVRNERGEGKNALNKNLRMQVREFFLVQAIV